MGDYTASRPFQAEFRGQCPRCYEAIEPGDSVRYVNDVLVHTSHARPETPVEICNQCWLTKPCECE